MAQTLILLGASLIVCSITILGEDTAGAAKGEYHVPQRDNDAIEVETNKGLKRQSVDRSRTGGIDWNNVVDVVIATTQKDIRRDQGIDEIPLPDSCEEFEHKLGFLRLRGSLQIAQGKFGNITSFQRIGDVSVDINGQIFKVEGMFSMRSLKVRYEHYEVNIEGLGTQGFLEATANSNSIQAVFQFESTPEGCVSTLQKLKVTKLGCLRVRVSGFGSLDSLASEIATWMVRQKKLDIAADIERVLTSEVGRIIADFQCDESASLLML